MQLETKDNTPADLSPEAKAALDKIGTAFEELKKKQDGYDEQLKNSTADIVTKEHVDRINADITKSMAEMQEVLGKEAKEREALESRFNKRVLNKSGDDPEEQKAAAFSRVTRGFNGRDAVLTAADMPHYKSAMDKIIRRKSDFDLTPEEQKAIRIGSDPAGGYLLTPDKTGDTEKFVHESSAMRQVAKVKTTNRDAKEGKYKLGKAGAAWAGEVAQRQETSTPEGGVWRIPVHELYAWPEISLKSLEDLDEDVEGELAEDVAEEFSRKEETAFFTGSGIGEPRGLLTYPAGTPAFANPAAYEKIQQIGTGVSGNFAASDPGDIFIDVIGNTKTVFLRNASWMLNRLTFAAVRKLKDGDGTFLWEKSLKAGQPFSLLGYSVEQAEDMPSLAGDSLSIGFGDFARAYTIVDRMGIAVLVDPFTSTTGFVKYKSRKRVGGAVTNFEAAKLIKFG